MKIGIKREGRNIWVSEGNSPTISSNGNPSPDPRLPGCGIVDKDAQALVVIPMASVISIQDSFMVPCTSGVDYTMVKTAQDVLRLADGGVPIKKLNVGNIHFREGKTRRPPN